jgi:hypothetical protein
MIGTQFTLTNKAHPERTITFNDFSSGSFAALQAYPTFDLEIRNDEIAREGQHGSWDFFSFYGKRLISFQGVIAGETEADVITLKDLLEQVTELPAQPTTDDNGTVLILWTDPLGRAVQTEAKIYSPTRYSRGMRQGYKLDFLMTLKSPSPAIESQELFEVNGLRGYPLGGLTLPFTLEALLATTLVNKFNVSNAGSTVAETTVRLYGSAGLVNNNPRLTNLTTGVFMQINVALADETEYIEIDSKLGTIVDQDGADLSGSIEAGSSFIRLNPGTNELLYTTDESTGIYGPLSTLVDPDEIIETEHRFGVL